VLQNFGGVVQLFSCSAPSVAGTRSAALTGSRKSEAEQLTFQFWGLVKAAHRLASEGGATGLAQEMFQTAQWASASEAAVSLAQMAARGAKGTRNLRTSFANGRTLSQSGGNGIIFAAS